MATFKGEYVGKTPQQNIELTVTYSGGNISWSILSRKKDGSTSGDRWILYGINVIIGGVAVYNKSELSFNNYTPGSTIASGTIAASSVKMSAGKVTCGASAGIGASGDSRRSSANGQITVATPTATITSATSPVVVGNNITFNFSESYAVTGITVTKRVLYFNNAVLKDNITTTSTTVAAPSVQTSGNYNFYYKAYFSDGAVATSANTVVKINVHTLPVINVVRSIRTNASYSRNDEGKYATLYITWTAGKNGNDSIATQGSVTINGHTYAISSGTTFQYSVGDLLVNRAYPVTYKVWDSLMDENKPVTRVDTISMGARGIDLAYGTEGYGVAVNTRATPGYFDIENLWVRMTKGMNFNTISATSEMDAVATEYNKYLKSKPCSMQLCYINVGGNEALYLLGSSSNPTLYGYAFKVSHQFQGIQEARYWNGTWNNFTTI